VKVAAFQFSGSGRIEDNFLAIQRGITQAAEQNVSFLLTQECALCGYPPIEIDSVSKIDFRQQEEAIEQISKLAIQHQMYIGLGTNSPCKQQLLDQLDRASFSPTRGRSGVSQKSLVGLGQR
jgi:omega-amidase